MDQVRERISVAFVDDHPAVLDALAAAAQAAGDMRVVGTARTLEAALALVRQVGTDAPQVVVSDVQLAGDAEGFRLLDQVRQGGPAIILLSAFDQPPLLRTAFERGAAGYLVKTDDVPAILAAVRVVAAGGSAFSGAMLRTIRNAPRRPSERELDVLRLLCTGASNDEIAVAMGLSERTVESHLRRMFDRYGVLSRTELAVLAVREGWSGGGGGVGGGGGAA
jgi:DNA-binding NarL/FixJ family response regulator